MGRGNSFLFDADFFHTQESVIIEEACGLEGIGIYVKLLCALRESETNTLTSDTKILSKLLRCSRKNLEKILKILLEKKIIFEKNFEIFSEKIINDVKKLEEKKTKLSENIKKRWEKRDTNVLQLNQLNKDKDKDKDKDIYNINISNKKYITLDDLDNLDIPTCWNVERVRESLKAWVEYKTNELREPYKTLSSLKSLLTTLKKSNPSTELVVYAINYAISRHWKGVALYKDVIEGFNQNTSATNGPISRAEKYRREHPEEFDANGNYVGKPN